MIKRIYISGRITGTTDFAERFAEAEKRLGEKGYEVVNPARIGRCLPELTHREYMTICFALMAVCDTVYVLRGEISSGVRQELEYAELTRMLIITEG
jgi:hypothetical protein